MNLDLRSELIRLANHFGADPEFVRAGGGNASFRSDGILHIKPSGTTLATLRGEDLVPLEISPLLDALTSDDDTAGDPVMAAATRARVGTDDGRRPSVEILFHALIPDPLVLHLHPLVANALTCNEQGAVLSAELLGDEAIWVDYVDPGVPLARAIATAREQFRSRKNHPAPAITMLGNHGIIVTGSTFDAVAERTTWLTGIVAAGIADGKPSAPLSEPSSTPENLTQLAENFRLATTSAGIAASAGSQAQSAIPDSAPVSQGPLIPDQIVYAGSLPVILQAGDDAQDIGGKVCRFRQSHGRPPIVAVIPGEAIFAVGNSDASARVALDTFLDALRVARDADRLGRVRVMDLRERHFIENWEAESYRRTVSGSA